MTGARWARITSVFRRALELPSAEERAAWLDQTCGSDLTLRRNVQRLLDAQEELSLESPAPDLLETGGLALEPGDELSHYRVEAKIGEGGMGTVYRALDTRLQRRVALKILPPVYAMSEDRKQALVREARAASSLNHPHIVTIYEVDSDQDLDFIAMEYIQGCPLTERIGTEGMPVAQLSAYAVQIADALAKAHAAKLLHRDIKPSNIMVTADDRVKVLDFGLAKLMEADTGADVLNPSLTGQGLVRGTPAYMSPEQAEGRKLDVRSDIFSLGCVLYEMATGRRPFRGDSNLAVMYKVVHEPLVPPSELVAMAPELQVVILRCLEKDPDRRFQTMEDLKSALEALDPQARARRTRPVIRRRLRNLALGAAALTILAAAGVLVVEKPWSAGAPVPQRTIKFAITPANLLRGGLGEVDSEVSISRDGKHIAYVESRGGQLWIRDIDREQARPVPGATRVYQVFWSPDNQWIGYSAGQGCGVRPGCDLVRIPVGGGIPQTIARLAGSFKRASWSSDGRTIVYCDSTGMYTVPAAGGPVTRIVDHPHIEHPSLLDLPGGRRAFLYQAFDSEQPSHAIYIQVQGEQRRRLIKVSESTNPYPAWSPTGHLIYVDGPNTRPAIWALPFSLATLAPTGSAFQIVESGASPMVSQTGTLVYGDPPSNRLQLTWVDRGGKRISTIGEPQVQGPPSLSPDGRNVAEVILDPYPDVSVYNQVHRTWTRLTSDKDWETIGTWIPSGDQFLYAARSGLNFRILSRSLLPGGEVKELVRSSSPLKDPVWSPDGRFLMYSRFRPATKNDVLVRERLGEGVGEERVFLGTVSNEQEARFSPDGKFVAYASDETGRNEVWVRDFPRGERHWQVSLNGGTAPRWKRDGTELFFAERAKLMAARVTTGSTFSAQPPAMLFETPRVFFLQFDASADGKRFLILERPNNETPLSVHVVQNWFEEFRGRVQ